MLGPVLFVVVLITLTFLNYSFLIGLGWHPLNAPTFDWPSGLALGKFGWLMTSTFVLSGLLIAGMALRLKAELPAIKTAQMGSVFLVLSGLALAGLAFTTDPTLRETPATWHGILHDASFVALGLTLFPAMVLLTVAFRAHPKWQPVSVYTALTLAFAVPAFILKGAAFYIFLLAVLIWYEVIAIRVN